MKQDRIAPPATLVLRALGGHAAIGLLAGGLIYLLCLSGALVVIHERWQRWEQPAVAEMQAMSPAAVQRAVEAVLAGEADKPRTTHLYVHLPTEELPRTVVTTDTRAVYVDQDGKVVGREGHSWTEFLINMHIYLHLPMTAGLILVGGLGVMLAALCVTGVVAHPRIFRDAFRLRARGASQLARADWHNRLGVWTLPFALALALTGAFIGLALVGAQGLAFAWHDGDIEKVYEPIFGEEAKPDARPAPAPNIAAALAKMRAGLPHVTPTYAIVHDPLTAGQHVQILADHPRRLIYGESYEFDAAGNYHGRVGLSDGPVGQQFAASIYKLHFGNFAGLPVALAYMLMGLALAAITSTGVSLWLQKRRNRGTPSPALEPGWSVIIWGSPILMLACAWLRGAAGPDAPLVALFWIGLALAMGAAMVRRPENLSRSLQRTLAIALAATAVGHAALLSPMPAPVLALDAGLLLAALVLWIVARDRPRAAAA